MFKRKPQVDPYRIAYYELHKLVMDLKEARARDVADRGEGMAPWGQYHADMRDSAPQTVRPLTRLLRQVNSIDQTLTGKG